jgi:hypothetical protein
MSFAINIAPRWGWQSTIIQKIINPKIKLYAHPLADGHTTVPSIRYTGIPNALSFGRKSFSTPSTSAG